MMVRAMVHSGGVDALSMDGKPASCGLGFPDTRHCTARWGPRIASLSRRVAVHDALPAIRDRCVPPDEEECFIDPPAAVSQGLPCIGRLVRGSALLSRTGRRGYGMPERGSLSPLLAAWRLSHPRRPVVMGLLPWERPSRHCLGLYWRARRPRTSCTWSCAALAPSPWIRRSLLPCRIA
jgi:hypothetical protein